MPYQEPKTCRFIIDYLQFYKSLGLLRGATDLLNGKWEPDMMNYDFPTDVSLGENNAQSILQQQGYDNLIGLDPTKRVHISDIGGQPNMPTGMNLNYRAIGVPFPPITVGGILGHNFRSYTDNLADYGVFFTWYYGSDTGNDFYTVSNDIFEHNEGFNATANTDGYSIFDSVSEYSDYFYEHQSGRIGLTIGNIAPSIDTDYRLKIGSIFAGRYYDMPHSADMQLTQSIEMDGITRKRSLGGSDLITYKYYKNLNWGEKTGLPPWELGNENNIGGDYSRNLSRVGRKSYDLTFSYLSDSEIFPKISSRTWFESVDSSYNSGNLEQYDTLFGNTLSSESSNFYADVLHKTLGGRLRFLFMPDKDDSSNIIIAKFDMNTFTLTQQAPNLYRIKVKIREVW